MLSIFLGFVSEQTRESLSRVLVLSGLPLGGAFSDGASVIRAVRQRGGGMVLCGGKLSDMSAPHLYDALAGDALLVVLEKMPGSVSLGQEGFVRLMMPASARELASQVRLLYEGEQARRQALFRRSPAEEELISEAKLLLQDGYGLDEPEAHRLLQRVSMLEGMDMRELARKILHEKNLKW